MKILLTGATGYIGKRLLPVLLEKGHEVLCCVREKQRFSYQGANTDNLKIIEVDFLKADTLNNIPADIDAAYYLIHSMTSSLNDFDTLESQTAENFKNYISNTQVKHVIYLSGIINDQKLSKHLQSRKNVEEILASGKYNFTTLRAGIIIGSGSASFEIMRDLVEKLPVMIAPRWLKTRSQPIAIRNVIEYLSRILLKKETYNKSYDIAGPDILSYKEMLLKFAKARELKRFIITVPVMTPRLSSYWLYFVTSMSYTLAVNLVDSMKVEVIGRKNDLADSLNIKLIPFEQAIKNAFVRIEQNEIISSWKDSMISGNMTTPLKSHIQVPTYGCFKDERHIKINNVSKVLKRIWAVGGETGWYYANGLWQIRGFLDKIIGGVGLRRGRTNLNDINAGDALDFWRVLLADKENRRLLLYAEMKLPGEAWLEFRIDTNNNLYQTATFRPKGVLGRLYWYSVLPFHFFVFNGMLRKIGQSN